MNYPLLVLLSIISNLAVISCRSDRVTVDLSKTTGAPFFIGANSWPGLSSEAVATVTSLSSSFRLVRYWGPLSFDGTWPTDLNQTGFDIVVAKHLDPHLESIKRDFAAFASAGVKVLVAGGSLPVNYMTSDHVMLPSRVADFSALWSAVLLWLHKNGLEAAYVEMTNEPQGNWNSRIYPADWVHLACTLARNLKSRGLSTSISGPGAGVLMGMSSEPYFQEIIAQNALQCLGLLSAHMWESPEETAGPSVLGNLIATYAALRDRVDPQHSLPWVATEYGVRTPILGGTTYKHSAMNCYPDSAATLPVGAECRSAAFVTRALAYTIYHMNFHFDGVAYWWLQDYSWSPQCVGLLHRDASRSQMYRAFSTVFGGVALASAEVVLPSSAAVDDVAMVVRITPRAIPPLVAFTIANAQPEALHRVISFRQIPGGIGELLTVACIPDSAHCTASLMQNATGIFVLVAVPADASLHLEVAFTSR